MCTLTVELSDGVPLSNAITSNKYDDLTSRSKFDTETLIDPEY